MFTELHMKYVFFLYGLSFFILGFAIIIYPKKHSMFALAPTFNWVAGFGLIHGINEWLDLFIRIHGPSNAAPLLVLRAVTLPASFFFLLLFGIQKVTEEKRHIVIRTLPWILSVAWLLMILIGQDKFKMLDIGSRYWIGLPGAMLTAYALSCHLEPLRQTGLTAVIKHLKLMIVVFGVYGVLAGAIVPAASFFPASVMNYGWVVSTLGVPIQIFRAVCAALLAYSTLQVLSVFHWETQQQLLENESRLRTIASASPAILFKSNITGELISIEGRGADSLPVPVGSLIGQPISELFPDFDFDSINAQSWKRGSVYSGTVTVGDKTYDIGYCPVQDDDGEISGYVGAAMDISERLKAQTEVNTYRRELSQTRRLTELGMMSKVLANKLTKPLNATQGLLQRLAVDLEKSHPDQGISDMVEQGLAEVHQAFSTVKRFCDDVDMPAHPKNTILDLHDFFARIIAVFEDRAQRVHLGIQLDVDASHLCLVIAPKELQYVISTLIEHILDRAGQNGQHEMQALAIQCQRHPGQAILLFRDNCRTLSHEEIQNAFVPFALDTADADHSGMGLAVVQKIIEENQGSITVNSQEGQGTSFELTLPICPSQEVHT